MTVPFVFNGGQMTDLPAYPGGPDPTALIEIVSPGNVEEGNNYAITLAQLAQIVGAGTPTILTTGTAYPSVDSDTRILLDLAVAAPFTITLDLASAYAGPVLVKDIGGTVGATNTLTVVFTGGESCDGLTSVVLSAPYAWFWFNPLEAGNFYET